MDHNILCTILYMVLDSKMKLPNMATPCKDCPFRKDTKRGWLGSDRMKEILKQDSFTCHKTDKTQQCAGHMLVKGSYNRFVSLAKYMSIQLKLSGSELLFDTEQECIKHHE